MGWVNNLSKLIWKNINYSGKGEPILIKHSNLERVLSRRNFLGRNCGWHLIRKQEKGMAFLQFLLLFGLVCFSLSISYSLAQVSVTVWVYIFAHKWKVYVVPSSSCWWEFFCCTCYKYYIDWVRVSSPPFMNCDLTW